MAELLTAFRRRGPVSAVRSIYPTVVVVALAIPVMAAPTELLGLAGAVRPSHYPASWQAADLAMGNGGGRVLALPWDEYLSFSFTGRVVHNPMGQAFRRETLISDDLGNPELETDSTLQRSAFLDFVIGHGSEMCHFGALAARVGVEWVVLAHDADWQTYGWLRAQQDLTLVRSWPDLTLYRNLAYQGSGQAGPLVRVSDWGQEVTKADAGQLGPGPVITARPAPGPIAPGCSPGASSDETPTGASAVHINGSGVSASLDGGGPRWTDLTWDPTWRSTSGRAVETSEGTVAVVSPGPVTLRLGLWTRYRDAYLVSIVVFFGACVVAWALKPQGSSANSENTSSPTTALPP